MDFLDNNATDIFCQLISKMDGQQHLKITNDPFMPLTIELIGTEIETPWGKGNQFSLCPYYIQYGDLMQDPEMGFIVIDQRSPVDKDVTKVFIFPYMFQQANLGIYQESMLVTGNMTDQYDRMMLDDHIEFANIWLQNILQQGFLNQPT